MYYIACIYNCKFQLDGHCQLSKCGVVMPNERNKCPHYVEREEQMLLPSSRFDYGVISALGQLDEHSLHL